MHKNELDRIIGLVNKYVQLERIGPEYNLNEVEDVMLNMDLYVRPENVKEVVKKGREAVAEGREMAEKTYSMVSSSVSKEHHTDCLISFLILKVIKESFDKEWFEQECNLRRNMDTCDKELLKEYLPKFDKEQLKEFLCILINYHHDYGFFFAGKSSTNMLYEFNKLCREKDPTVIDMATPNTAEWENFFESRGMYMFDILDLKTISDIIIKHIDREMIWADNMAEMFLEAGVEATANYPIMCMKLQRQLGPNGHILR